MTPQRHQRTDWPLLAGLAASAAVHAALAWSSLRLAWSHTTGRSADSPARLVMESMPARTPTAPPRPPDDAAPPEPLTQPPETPPPAEPAAPEQKPTEIRLGVDESDAVTATWIGVAPKDATEASGRRSTVDQAAFALPSGAPEPLPGSPGSAGGPSVAAPTPQPQPAPTPTRPPKAETPEPPARVNDRPALLPGDRKGDDGTKDTSTLARPLPAESVPPVRNQPEQSAPATSDAASLIPGGPPAAPADTTSAARPGASRPDRPEQPTEANDRPLQQGERPSDKPATATPATPSSAPRSPDPAPDATAPGDKPAPLSPPADGKDDETAAATPGRHTPDTRPTDPAAAPRDQPTPPGETPQQPNDSPPLEPARESSPPAPSSGPASPAVAPVPAGQTPESTSGELSDRESEATTTKDVIRTFPGRPAAAQGVQIRTVRPRFSNYTTITAAPRDAIVQIAFGPDGRVVEVTLVRSSGFADVDRPILDAVYNWTASGERIRALPQKPPGQRPATLELKFQIVLSRM